MIIIIKPEKRTGVGVAMETSPPRNYTLHSLHND